MNIIKIIIYSVLNIPSFIALLIMNRLTRMTVVWAEFLSFLLWGDKKGPQQ